MRVLIACEKSGKVRQAFAERGHEAYSCDIEPSEDGGPHILGDVLENLGPCRANNFKGWDMMIAFPPCTFLSGSGIHWNNRGRGWSRTEEALMFVATLLNAPIGRISLENPVGIIAKRLAQIVSGGKWVVKPNDGKRTCPPAQSIQPHQFGHDASKRTCLWLKNLPLLIPTKIIPPRMVDGKPRWANQTDSGQNRLGPSPTRAADRARTYQGIADAMAEQWGEIEQFSLQ